MMMMQYTPYKRKGRKKTGFFMAILNGVSNSRLREKLNKMDAPPIGDKSWSEVVKITADGHEVAQHTKDKTIIEGLVFPHFAVVFKNQYDRE